MKYALYLAISVALLIEASLRFGLVPNENHRIAQSLKHDDSAFSVLILGDSFSLDEEKSAVGRLGRYFAAKGVASLNLAGSGYGPLSYLEKYLTYGRFYRPDLVIVNYYSCNDQSNTQWAGDSRRELFKGTVKEWIRKSYLVAALMDLRAGLIGRRRLERMQAEIVRSDLKLDGISPFLVELAREHPDYLTTNLLMEGPGPEAAWATNRDVIDRIAAQAKRDGARLVINVFPSTVQVNASHFPFYEKLGFKTDPRTLSENRPQQRMTEFCRERGYDCFDLLPAFRGALGEHYLEKDDHWNEAGNRLAFELIRARLESSGALNH